MELPVNRTVLLHVQYDGTDFCGWQSQPEQRSVQDVLIDRIGAMVQHPVELHASSRTDSGVHARAMPVAFDTCRTISPRGFLRGLNSTLPADLSVLDVTDQRLGFRPRDAAVAKTYVYRYQLGTRRALQARYTWWVRRPALDLATMRAAAGFFIGEHDYSAFRSVHCDSQSTLRTIHSVAISEPDDDEVISVTITGNAFLRNMIRVMAGALFTVGLNRRAPEWVRASLETGERDHLAQTAPSSGLTLAKVHFSGYPRIGKHTRPDLPIDYAQPAGETPTRESS